MRLTRYQIDSIKSAGENVIPGFKIYLYGSRTDDSKKGGDIDLMITGDRALTFEETSFFLDEIYKKIGVQRIDVASFTPNSDNTFFKLISLDAVEI